MRATWVVAAVALLIPLSACGGGSEKPRATPSVMNWPPPAHEPLPGTTQPGTRLRFGQKAVITIGPVEELRRLGVIVNGIERGGPEDMAVLRSIQEVQGSIPYFVKVTLVNEDGGGDGWGSYSGPELRGGTESGWLAGAYDFLGPGYLPLPHCKIGDPPGAGFSVKGARHEVCKMKLAPPGDPVTKVGIQVDSGKPDITWE